MIFFFKSPMDNCDTSKRITDKAEEDKTTMEKELKNNKE